MKFINLPLRVVAEGLSTWEDYQLDECFKNFWKDYHILVNL